MYPFELWQNKLLIKWLTSNPDRTKKYVFFQSKKYEKRKKKKKTLSLKTTPWGWTTKSCSANTSYMVKGHTLSKLGNMYSMPYAPASLEWRRKSSAPPIEPVSAGRKKAFPGYKLLASILSSLPEPYSFSQSVGGWISPRELAQIMSPYLSAL